MYLNYRSNYQIDCCKINIIDSCNYNNHFYIFINLVYTFCVNPIYFICFLRTILKKFDAMPITKFIYILFTENNFRIFIFFVTLCCLRSPNSINNCLTYNND